MQDRDGKKKSSGLLRQQRNPVYQVGETATVIHLYRDLRRTIFCPFTRALKQWLYKQPG